LSLLWHPTQTPTKLRQGICQGWEGENAAAEKMLAKLIKEYAVENEQFPTLLNRAGMRLIICDNIVFSEEGDE
jgi:hypothetical protein